MFAQPHVFRRRLQEVSKTSWSRPIYSSWPYFFKTSSRSFQHVFKTPSRCFQHVLKTSSKCLQDLCKTSSRHLRDVLQRHIQDIFKAYHQVNLFQLTRTREVFNTFLRRSFPKAAIYRGICLGSTTSKKFMVSVQNLQEREKILKFQFFTKTCYYYFSVFYRFFKNGIMRNLVELTRKHLCRNLIL